MITNAGLNLLRNWMYGDSVNALSHIGIGTGISTPQATETDLVASVLRKAFTAQIKGTDGIATYEMTLLTSEGNGNTLTEVGIFNAVSSGDMLNRITHTGVPKTSDVELKYEIELTAKRVV